MAQTLTLDDFLVPPIGFKADLNPQSSTSFTLANPGSIGGTRAVTFTNNYSSGSFSSLNFNSVPFTSSASGRQNGATISLPAGGGPSGDVDLEFVYFANGAGLGVDLTIYPEIALLWEGDHHGFQNSSSVSLALEDSLGNTHTETFSYAAGTPNVYFIETLRWNLNEFANEGVNLSDIDKITLLVNTDGSADYQFSSLIAVPEPSSVLMMVLSCGAFLFHRRR